MSWSDDIFDLTGEPLEALQELDELGLGDPDTWQSYDVYMDEDNHSVNMSIIDENGESFEFEITTDLDDVDYWDWVWDIWDWILDNYPDVETDSQYAEQ